MIPAEPEPLPRTPKPGVKLAVDVGSVRVGVARSDPQGTLAVPVETINRRTGDDAVLDRLVHLTQEWDAVSVVVGNPVRLSGDEGPAAVVAREFAGRLAARLRELTPQVEVRLVDERLSTVQAQRGLHAAGRSTRTSRAVIDQAAAVVLLQHALDAQRGTGQPVGAAVIGT